MEEGKLASYQVLNFGFLHGKGRLKQGKRSKTQTRVIQIFLPLAQNMGTILLLVMGAIVSGARLGSHACFYLGATVLTFSCCKVENMDHALS